MDDAFTKAVDDGLRLSRRVCIGGGRNAPQRPAGMQRSSPSSLHPTAPMLYAVIGDPAIVDNPDVPSYQPHVHGRMDPPALVPLQLNEMALEVSCWLDMAFVEVRGTWRVHCVMGSKSCDCRFVVPLGEQGSILGVEAGVSKRSYFTEVSRSEENGVNYKVSKDDVKGCLRPQMFSFTVHEVNGGSNVSIKVVWCQKLLYKDGQFSVAVPYSFPEFCNPYGKSTAKREKMKLDVRTGTGKEVICQTSSHALKESRRESGGMFFSYEADVLTWSTVDFMFSYTVYSNDLFGGILLQSPPVEDFDQREMFSLYLFPGNKTNQQKKVFKNKVVFVIDKSESMRGRTLEHVKNALLVAISELSPGDSFNIVAFDDDTYTFSSSLEPASNGIIDKATQWINKLYVAGGGTNIMQPLVEALGMLSDAEDSVPHIFLITDGSVEEERNICTAVKKQLASQGHWKIAPRISTFGLGSFCNHYFLRMLATLGKGQYDAAFDVDSIEIRMRSFFQKAFSPLFVDIAIDLFEDLDGLEVHPFPIPDLLWDRPLVISGRYLGDFPDAVKATGIWADMSNFMVDLNVKRINDIPLNKISSKVQIDLMTSHAWFANSKELEEKVIKLSKQTGFPSEYTHMMVHERDEMKLEVGKEGKKTKLLKHPSTKGRELVQGLTLGFGNVTATMQNLPTGFGQVKLPEPSDVLKKAVGCCSCLCDCCCCRCCIKICSGINDQCAIVATQICAALSFLACYESCSECCCCGSD